MTLHQQMITAISTLRPASGFALNGDVYPDGLEWLDDSTKPPTLDEVNAVMALPPPLPPAYLSTFALLGRLTTEEYTAIRQAATAQLAAGDGQLEHWLDMARTAPRGLDLNDPVVTTAKAALVSAGLLTKDRADVAFAP